MIFAHGAWLGGHALYVKDNRVVIDVSGQPYLDLEREAAAMLARE